jgi:outer membrane biosynthesis protein TonB
MEDKKNAFNQLKLKFYKMKRSTKIIIIIFFIIISSLTFLILKNYIFKEEKNYLKEKDTQVLDGELTAAESAAELRKEIREKQIKNSESDLSEKIMKIEELRDPFFPSKNGEKENSPEKAALIYSESELKADNKESNKKENDVKEIYREKNGRETEESGVENENNSKNNQKNDTAAEAESLNGDLKRKIIEIEIPFSLLGIIKDNNTAAALFSYNGKVIKKSEGENIENFKIEKINKEMIVLAYDNFKYNQYIWRHDEIEEN